MNRTVGPRGVYFIRCVARRRDDRRIHHFYYRRRTPLTVISYQLGTHDDLKLDQDGSLTIYIQHESPGKEDDQDHLRGKKGMVESRPRELAPLNPPALDRTEMNMSYSDPFDPKGIAPDDG